MATSPVRVRFAPSPTGFLHLGGIRSALYNWLLARQTGGQFILRIEDTDRTRLVTEAIQQIQDSLMWLGLDWDEGPGVGGAYGPYIQSERLELYRQYSEQLVQEGKAYGCWCSPERLEQLREEAKQAGQAFKYDRHCLNNPGKSDQPHVIRFKMPETASTKWHDELRGEMGYDVQLFDDFVILKSDGFATYNFAHVVDDHLMEITHVIRGEEFIASTPRHVEIYMALGWELPKFVHLPQVLGPDKTKLSKRHGARSTAEFEREGYLPDAVLNFLALLGWNEGEGSTKELYTRDELIQAFDIHRIQKSPAVFDIERLNWLNGVYIRERLSEEDLLQFAEPFWPASAKSASQDYRRQVLALVRERLKYLAELAELTSYFFETPSLDAQAKTKLRESKDILQEVQRELESCDFSENCLENHMRKVIATRNVKPREVFQPVRLAVSGQEATPGIFETLSTLGKETVMNRLNAALAL